MKLTDEEKSMLGGEQGKARKKSMEILVALGKIYGAQKLLEVTSVQVSGVSYHNLGQVGLEWLEEMAEDGRAKVLATLNPAGMDLGRWRSQGVDQSFAKKQLAIIEAYKKMGIAPSCTCTPYLTGNLPAPGEHIGWAESSAVTFANSVLGARTNREGGPSALAAALTGRTPGYGFHLTERRQPTVTVTVEGEVRGTAAFGALGCALGQSLPGQAIPYIRSFGPPPSIGELKALSASFVTFGGSPLFLLEGTSPEADRYPIPDNTVTIDQDDINRARDHLRDDFDAVDLVCVGCPHASLRELSDYADALEGKQVRTKMWICTAGATYHAADQVGLIARIESSGALVVRDTCFVVAPLKGTIGTVVTDSAKGCFYARGHNGMHVKLGSVDECIQTALSGRWS